jgi:hypothetical protein
MNFAQRTSSSSGETPFAHAAHKGIPRRATLNDGQSRSRARQKFAPFKRSLVALTASRYASGLVVQASDICHTLDRLYTSDIPQGL